MNPPVLLPLLVPVLAAVILVVGWLSWRSTAALPLPRRFVYLSLRVLGAGALAALLLNPGKWVRPSSETPSPWLVLLDRSASMAVSDSAGKSLELAGIASEFAKDQDVPIRL